MSKRCWALGAGVALASRFWLLAMPVGLLPTDIDASVRIMRSRSPLAGVGPYLVGDRGCTRDL